MEFNEAFANKCRFCKNLGKYHHNCVQGHDMLKRSIDDNTPCKDWASALNGSEYDFMKR